MLQLTGKMEIVIIFKWKIAVDDRRRMEMRVYF